MITTYNFEKIDNNNYLKYNGTYTPNGFSFTAYPYFTTIVTNYNNGSYSDATTPDDPDNVITRSDIFYMLDMGVKVDLIVKGKNTADLILPLGSIDGNYAYFSNGELTLTVDSNGAVTEFSTNPVE